MPKDPLRELDPVLDPPTVQEVISWLRENYEDISTACEEKGLPKPPRW